MLHRSYGAALMDGDLEHCLTMIASEEQLAKAAPSSEVAEMHLQLAMLYRAQFEHLRRSRSFQAGDLRAKKMPC
jgi:hypothetical protein